MVEMNNIGDICDALKRLTRQKSHGSGEKVGKVSSGVSLTRLNKGGRERKEVDNRRRKKST